MCPARHDEAERLRKPLSIKTVLRDQQLSFSTSWGIFSPREIDAGSKMLLDYVEVEPSMDCLDLGCGYGVLGITLAKLAADGSTKLLDKDYVAVEFANKNVALNNLTNCRASLSNGFSALKDDERFDIIVSNLPAKVGNELLDLFMYDAMHHLKPGGRFYVVTITGLRKFVQRRFKDIFGNYKKHKQNNAYTVASATKPT